MRDERRGDPRHALLVALSLSATSASGMNASAFWALRGDFDWGWWAPNLVLLLGPWPFLWRLWRALAAASRLGPSS